jgi:hypothetical protein
LGISTPLIFVIAGLVPAIQGSELKPLQPWITGTSPLPSGLTTCELQITHLYQ